MATTLALSSNPALLIIDMQNGFLDPFAGTFGKFGLDTSRMRAVVPAINRLRSLAHSLSVPIIFTRMCWNEDYSDSGIVLKSVPYGDTVKQMKGFIRGSWDADIVDELKPREEELVIDKTRHTAFYGTSLSHELESRGVSQLIVTGVGTNVCVESTVRDAVTKGWECILVEGATATVDEEEEASSLKAMGNHVCPVIDHGIVEAELRERIR